MTAHTITTNTFPPTGPGPLTVEDLQGFPEDGRRCELIDGTLIVSPVPGRRHQAIVSLLQRRLEAVCPPKFDVARGPFAVRPDNLIELRPDVLVGRYQDFTAKGLAAAPVLAVEVLSPSTALNDWNTKKALYARLGVESYWVIDPTEPALTAFEIASDGGYRRIAKVTGDEVFTAERPFAVRVVPSALLSKQAGG